MKRTTIILILLIKTVCVIAQTPDWEWAIQAGGDGVDHGYAITIDNSGNNYITGYFQNVAIFGSDSLTSTGEGDIFIAKIDANGNWEWATQAGGNEWDKGYGIAIDDSGNSYITGYFRDVAIFGAYSLTSYGCEDIFVAKIDVNGNWEWAIQAGGTAIYDFGKAIAIDDSGNLFITGYFRDTVTFGSYSLTSYGSFGYEDIFVAKIDANGNWLWVTQAGGIGIYDNGRGIVIDNTGNAYVTGSFKNNATFGSYSLSSFGATDIFVAKIDTNGNWQWATKAGGNYYDYGSAITVDDFGNTYVTGGFFYTAIFGSYSLISGDLCTFIAKLDVNGNWEWAIQAVGGHSFGTAITIDDPGNTYITGSFEGEITFGSDFLISNGGQDIFVVKLDTLGNLYWGIQAGGNSYDHGNGITIDDFGNVYVTGDFQGTATFGSNTLISYGSSDIFVAKLNNPLSAENEINPIQIKLSNYPNPFNPSTIIEFSIQNNSQIDLSIFNIKGQKLKTLANNTFTKGLHSINWNGDDENGEAVGSGVYLYKLNVNGKTEAIKKCLLLK